MFKCPAQILSFFFAQMVTGCRPRGWQMDIFHHWNLASSKHLWGFHDRIQLPFEFCFKIFKASVPRCSKDFFQWCPRQRWQTCVGVEFDLKLVVVLGISQVGCNMVTSQSRGPFDDPYLLFFLKQPAIWLSWFLSLGMWSLPNKLRFSCELRPSATMRDHARPSRRKRPAKNALTEDGLVLVVSALQSQGCGPPGSLAIEITGDRWDPQASPWLNG